MQQVLLELASQEQRRIYWEFTITELQYQALVYEVKTYNQWISLLLTGKAPDVAYRYLVHRNFLYLTNSGGVYQSISRTIQVPEKYKAITDKSYSLSLYKFKNTDTVTVQLKHEFDNNQLILSSNEHLRTIITKPFDAADHFSIGYIMLPFTKMLLSPINGSIRDPPIK